MLSSSSSSTTGASRTGVAAPSAGASALASASARTSASSSFLPSSAPQPAASAFSESLRASVDKKSVPVIPKNDTRRVDQRTHGRSATGGRRGVHRRSRGGGGHHRGKCQSCRAGFHHPGHGRHGHRGHRGEQSSGLLVCILKACMQDSVRATEGFVVEGKSGER